MEARFVGKHSRYILATFKSDYGGLNYQLFDNKKGVGEIIFKFNNESQTDFENQFCIGMLPCEKVKNKIKIGKEGDDYQTLREGNEDSDGNIGPEWDEYLGR